MERISVLPIGILGKGVEVAPDTLAEEQGRLQLENVQFRLTSDLNFRKEIATDTEKRRRKRRKDNQIGGYAKMGHADQRCP